MIKIRSKPPLDSGFWILDSRKQSSRAGQSIMEVLVAIALGVLLIGAAAGLILPALKSNAQATNIQESATLANGLLGNVRVWSEGSWNNLLGLATGTANTYFLQTAKSPFVVASGTEYISNDNVTSSLLGWWKFNEGYGSSTLDSSGDNNTGTWNGTPGGAAGTYYTVGRLGQYSGYFDGSTDYVNLGTSTSLSVPGAGTITAWINPANLSTIHWIADVGDDADDLQLGLEAGRSANKLDTIWGTGGGGFDILYSSSSLSLNNWQFVAVTRTGSGSSWTASLYINGVLDSTQAGTHAPSSFVKGFIGAFTDSGGQLFSGSIDDVRIYGRALSAAEISSIYHSAYRRYFYLSDIYRSSTGTIVSSGGSYDPSSKEVTVGYGWYEGVTDTISTLLTRNENFIVDQNNWSGGAAGSGTVETTTNSQFATSSDIDYTTTTGSFYLAIPGY